MCKRFCVFNKNISSPKVTEIIEMNFFKSTIFKSDCTVHLLVDEQNCYIKTSAAYFLGISAYILLGTGSCFVAPSDVNNL